jgi:hypothetical protein
MTQKGAQCCLDIPKWGYAVINGTGNRPSHHVRHLGAEAGVTCTVRVRLIYYGFWCLLFFQVLFVTRTQLIEQETPGFVRG